MRTERGSRRRSGSTRLRRTRARATGRGRGRRESGRQTLLRRGAVWATSVKTLTVGAVCAGVAGLVTAAVTDLPGWLAGLSHDPQSPVTVTGRVRHGVGPADPPTPAVSTTLDVVRQLPPTNGAASSRAPSPSVSSATPESLPEEERCGLSGRYVLPDFRPRAREYTDRQALALLRSAASADRVTGSYVFSAGTHHNVVITAVHTVLLKRVPAPRATTLTVNSGCYPELLPTYSATVNLDTSDPEPVFSVPDPDNRLRSIPAERLAFKITPDSPALVVFYADTTKYDVTWKFRVDYTVDGRAQSLWVLDGGRPFRAIAPRTDNPALEITRNVSGWWDMSIPSRPPG